MPAQNTISYPTLISALNIYSITDLKRLMEVLGTSTRATRKGEIIAHIENLYVGDGLAALWNRLKKFQKAAVAEVVYSESDIFNLGQFIAKYDGNEPEEDEIDGRARFGSSRSQFTPLNFFLFQNHLPLDLKERLKALAHPPEPVRLKSTDVTPEAISYHYQYYDSKTGKRETQTEVVPVTAALETEFAARMDLISVLSLIEGGGLVVGDKTRQPGAAALSAIGALLAGGDYYGAREEEESSTEIGPIKPFAWVMLAQAGGLAEFNGRRLALTPAGKKALSEPPENTLRSLWKKWQSNTLLDELRRINVVKGQTGIGKSSLTAPSRRRGVIAQALADCPLGRWVDIHDFLSYMTASGHLFEVTRDPWSFYIFDAQYGSMGYDNAHLLESRYVFCLLFEYAATLGLLDIAYIPPQRAPSDYGDQWGAEDLAFFSRYDGLTHFRVNALGEYCLGKSSQYKPPRREEPAVLNITPQGEIEPAGDGLTPGDRLLLEVFAEPVSEDAWRLEPPKLLAAMEEGRPLDMLREFLLARSGGELPQQVRLFLTEVETRASRLSDIGAARLIDCGDAVTAAQIAEDPRTRRHCRRAGERILAVPNDQEIAFRRALRGMGYVFPVIKGA